MKPLSLNISKMKKIGGDKKSTIFQHPDGHQIRIAHSGLSALHRKQIEKLDSTVEKFAEGGSVDIKETPEESATKAISEDQFGEPSPYKAEVGPRVTSKNAASLHDINDRKPVSDGNDEVEENDPEADIPAEDPKKNDSSKFTQEDLTDIGNAGLASMGVQPQTTQMQQPMQQAVQQPITQEQPAVPTDQQPSGLSQDLDKNQQSMDEIVKRQRANDDNLDASMRNNTIDPKRFFNNMSTGHKIGAAIAMILGGASAGTLGGENPAVKIFNKEIENDIDAQKNDQTNKINLFKLHREALGDDREAAMQTRNNLLQVAKVKLDEQMGNLPGPMAGQRATLLKSQIDNEIAMNNMKLAAFKAAKAGGDDPARLVPFMVPQDHQKQAFYEIEAAENTRKMSSDIVNSFEQAAKENTVLKTGAGLLRTPGSVYALHQSMQPTFKDLEGTVRQAAMENTFKNITPMPGDSEHTIGQKRTALHEYLKSKLSAPTARGYGIDLQKFQRTAPYQQQQTATMNGQQYIKVQGGWKKVQ